MSRFHVGFETELPLGKVEQKRGGKYKIHCSGKYHFELIPEFHEYFFPQLYSSMCMEVNTK